MSAARPRLASVDVRLFQGEESVSVAMGPNHHVAALVAEALARMGRLPDVSGWVLADEETGDVKHHGHTVRSAGIGDGDSLVLARNTEAV